MHIYFELEKILLQQQDQLLGRTKCGKPLLGFFHPLENMVFGVRYQWDTAPWVVPRRDDAISYREFGAAKGRNHG